MTKVCIISGGSGGLGLSIATRLLEKGLNVVVLGPDAEKLIKAAEWLQEGTL